MKMEFLSRNFFNTSSVVTVNTGSVSSLFDRKSTLFTATLATTTATTFTADFVISQDINRIALQNINFKNFKVVDNGGTPLTISGADTTSAAWTGNSATSLYLNFNTLTAATITLIVSSNTAASLSHTIEEIWFCELLHQLTDNPPVEGYKVKNARKEFVHETADGGTISYILNDYFTSELELSYISDADRTTLRSVYDQNDAITFTPFGTGSSWDNQIYEVLWIGDFTFNQRAGNDDSLGFNGTISLRETAK